MALLLAAGAMTPRPAMTESSPGPHLPKIRIHSELKGPEVVVIDTSRPIVGPTPITQNDMGTAVAQPDPQAAENVDQPVSPALKQADAKEQSKVGPQLQSRSNVGRARTKRRPTSYAQRPDVGPFDGRSTFYQQDARFRESFAQMVPPQQRQRSTKAEAAWTRTERARRAQPGWFNTGW